jgi:hypothetical protein
MGKTVWQPVLVSQAKLIEIAANGIRALSES